MPEFLVGIDLGTTNSALSYARLGGREAPISFGIRQLIAAGAQNSNCGGANAVIRTP